MSGSVLAARSLGELLATIASEASNNPFVGSDEQKAAWDEIKARFAKLEREVALAHEELDSLDVQRTSLGGPFSDIKYEEREINLAGRIKCLGVRAER